MSLMMYTMENKQAEEGVTRGKLKQTGSSLLLMHDEEPKA